MGETISQNLFYVLVTALFGGVAARFIKIPVLVGYIISGLIFSTFFPFQIEGAERLAELGIILLLFSVGVELSWNKLARVWKVVVIGAILQMWLFTIIFWFILSSLGFSAVVSLILSAGFSLSSTALVVRLLEDRGETSSIHGEFMIGWLLVQDLAVIPMVVFVSTLAGGGDWAPLFGKAVLQALILIVLTVFLGRLLVPYIVHKVASFNSRELLILTGVSFALGIAALSSFFGVSPGMGAFLAGVVISETQEHHAIFAETRPLRDLFVIIFFVTLGFLVSPQVIISNFGLIILIAGLILLIKFLVIFFLSILLDIKGKSAVSLSLGLTQVGEFSFVLFLTAKNLNIIDPNSASIGVASTLLTLLVTPLMFKNINPLWRKLKSATEGSFLAKIIFSRGIKSIGVENKLKEHIIICGFGRVGRWIGKAFDTMKIPYIVIDYNQSVVKDVMEKGIPVIYGDPSQPGVLEQAGIKEAKVIVVALPDRFAQEEVISYVQTVSPFTKIISRAHLDEDWERLSQLKIEKVVQPEFEAAIAIIKQIFINMGKSKEEISTKVKNIRLAHVVRK